ncbi:MAG: hypothetical protein N2746_05120 [Deltaproteobacteria bacterium]|nr:hypothetical protein [Deltaproteobacteria bacterium]
MIIYPTRDKIAKYVKRSVLYEYLGIKELDKVPKNIIRDIDNSEGIFIKLVSPYVVYNEFKKFEFSEEGVSISDHFIKSFVLSWIAQNAVSVYIFIATIGDLLEKEVASLYSRGSFFMAQVADAYGSVYVEALLEFLIEYIEIEEGKKGLLVSAPYSPGYCDIDLSYQKVILDLLGSENSIVSINEAYQMYPGKSVSGILFKMPEGKAKVFKNYFVCCEQCSNFLCKQRKK